MTTILKCLELEKTYPNGIRVGPFNLSVGDGEVVGLLGENGAGKTTLLEMAAGLRSPTGGELKRRLGESGGRVGYLPHRLDIYDWMKGYDVLEFVAGFYSGWDRGYAVALAQRLELRLSLKYAELSRGNQIKLGLICALAHDPPLLLLDEPTAGLDPVAKREFSAAVSDHRERSSCAVIVSSHVFEDLTPLSSRYVLIKRGRIVGDTPAAEVGEDGIADWFWSHYPADQ